MVESPDVHFEPLVKLAPVEVKTMEENEEEIFKMQVHPAHTSYYQIMCFLVWFTPGELSCFGLTVKQTHLSGKNEVQGKSSFYNTRHQAMSGYS